MIEPPRPGHVPGQLTLDDAVARPRLLSLFTGYGGLDLAVAQVLDVELIGHAEVYPAACRVLAARFPGVPNLGDVAAVDWSAVGPVDVITGGFPCQDVSLAGRRLGITHDTRSGLWAHMSAAVDVLRPSLVVIENVRGLLSARAHHPAHSDVEPCPWCLAGPDDVSLRALGAVLGDLADVGYDAAWRTVSAADVGAPHGRARVFVIARPADAAADTDGDGRQERRTAPAGLVGGPHAAVGGAAAADAAGDQRAGRAETGPAVWPDGSGPRPDAAGRSADADRWGPYGPAVARWAAVLGRPAPPPTEPNTRGAQRLSPAFVEWMMGLPAGWVTGVPGIGRNDALRLLGNGVVPQQAAAAIRSLLLDVTATPAPVVAGGRGAL